MPQFGLEKGVIFTKNLLSKNVFLKFALTLLLLVDHHFTDFRMKDKQNTNFVAARGCLECLQLFTFRLIWNRYLSISAVWFENCFFGSEIGSEFEDLDGTLESKLFSLKNCGDRNQENHFHLPNLITLHPYFLKSEFHWRNLCSTWQVVAILYSWSKPVRRFSQINYFKPK